MERVADDADQRPRDSDDVIFTSSGSSTSSAVAKFLHELKVIARLAWPTVGGYLHIAIGAAPGLKV